MKSLLRNHILTGKVCCSEDGSHYCSAECERKRITLFPSVVIALQKRNGLSVKPWKASYLINNTNITILERVNYSEPFDRPD